MAQVSRHQVVSSAIAMAMPLFWMRNVGPPAVSVPAAPVVPALQQAYISSCNPAGINDVGDAFKYRLGAPVGSGNGVIIAASYPHGIAASITDNNGNSWGSAAKSVDAGSGAYILSVWYLKGANSGATQFELNIGGTQQQPVSWAIYEFNNLGALDVTAGATLQSGSSLATGSMTTTAADFIFAVYHPAGAIGGNPTGWTAGSGFTLMEADIAWQSDQGYPKATQTMVQSSAGAINPTISIASDSIDVFNCVAIAIKVAASGTAFTGMRALKKIEFSNNNQTSSTWKLQTPTLGNLRFIATTIANSAVPISSVTDSESNTWTALAWNVDSCQGYWLKGADVNGALATTINFSGTGLPIGTICAFFDIANANTSSQPGTVASNGLISIGASATTAPNQPSFTPTSSSGSWIAALLDNQGAGGGSTAGLTTGISSPSGAVWAGATYVGHTGGSNMDFGDGWATLTGNTSTSTQNWTWTVNPITGGNNVAGAAVEFLP